MASPEFQSSCGPGDGDHLRSKFTYRDLRHLGQASVSCPLRVITLVDFDAFYAQCESVRLGLPEDRPLGVQQFTWVIALNYAAKNAGLKRPCSPEDAKLGCPDIVLQHVATWREGEKGWAYRPDVQQHIATDKAALDPYRLESRRALEVVKNFLPKKPLQKVEKASIDEIFVDLSSQVHEIMLDRYPELSAENTESLDSYLPQPWSTLLDWQSDKVVASASADEESRPPDWDDVSLCIGAEIVRNLRAEIHDKLRYTCSAGVARNKVLAKLAAGHNKPNQQTVVRARAIGNFFSTYKFTKLRGLGGDGGQNIVKSFGTDEISELLLIPLRELRSKLGADFGQWVYNVIRGHEHAEVVSRTQIQSMLTAKTFPGSLQHREQAEKWLHIFAQDLVARVNDLNAEESPPRRPTTIVLHHASKGRFGPTRSKQKVIPQTAEFSEQTLFTLSKVLLTELENEGPTWPCLTLSMGVSKMEDCITENHQITSFFTRGLQSNDRPAAYLDSLDTKDVALPHAKRRKIQSSEVSQTGSKDLDTTVGFRSLSDNAQALPPDLATNPADRVDKLPGEYVCPRCSESIPELDVLEHLDWHVAMDLQSGGSFST